MKSLLLSILLLSLISCQIENDIEAISPSIRKINGQWQLYKTKIGYPTPNGPHEIKAINTEIINFDATTKTFTRSINGKITENTIFDIQQLSYVGSQTREAVVFEKTGMYAYLTFDDANSAIILYEKTPTGAVLADGNSYHYQKMK